MSAEARLKELGIELPKPSTPAGTYMRARVVDGYVHVSGQGPRDLDGKAITGKVPSERTVEEAIEAARLCGLQCLAAIREAAGSLDRVDCVVRSFGMVNADPDFGEHPRVIDGFANLFVDVFGEAGKGARSAVGMGSLPFGITVEVETTVKLKNG